MLVELGGPQKTAGVKGNISIVSNELLSLRKQPLKTLSFVQAKHPVGTRRRQTLKRITDLQEPEP